MEHEIIDNFIQGLKERLGVIKYAIPGLETEITFIDNRTFECSDYAKEQICMHSEYKGYHEKHYIENYVIIHAYKEEYLDNIFKNFIDSALEPVAQYAMNKEVSKWL